MRNGLVGLMTLILLAFFSLGITAQGVAADANATANISAQSEDTSMPAAPTSVQGIWKVSLAGADITMAINQSGDSLFGQCKFEGDTPWNGVVAGSVSGRIVNIAMAALQGKILVSTGISGIISDDSISGNYVRSDSNGLAAKGDMDAVKISADPTEYTTAKVETSTTSVEQTSTEQIQQLGSQTSINRPNAASSSTKYNDVTDLAKSINPNILPRHAPL